MHWLALANDFTRADGINTRHAGTNVKSQYARALIILTQTWKRSRQPTVRPPLTVIIQREQAAFATLFSVWLCSFSSNAVINGIREPECMKSVCYFCIFTQRSHKIRKVEKKSFPCSCFLKRLAAAHCTGFDHSFKLLKLKHTYNSD